MSHFCIGALLFGGIIASKLISNDYTGKLGPTDAVVLSGEEGDMTVSNKDGRISWGEQKTSTAWSIGFIETGKALEKLMKADHFNFLLRRNSRSISIHIQVQ